MNILKQPAIDVHAHCGRYELDSSELINRWMTGDGNEVVRRAKTANTDATIASSLKALFEKSPETILEGNRELAHEANEIKGLLHWVVLHPGIPESYDQAAEMLLLKNCVGVKIHPAAHDYTISDFGEYMFAFAVEHNAVLITHTGEEGCMPADFLPFADRCAEVKLILGHLGFAEDGDPGCQVRAIQHSKHENIYVDTSSSRNMLPGLIEWAVKEIGSDRILYGTDSPLYWAPMQRARIDSAEISDEDKRKILYENAAKLLNLNSFL